MPSRCESDRSPRAVLGRYFRVIDDSVIFAAGRPFDGLATLLVVPPFGFAVYAALALEPGAVGSAEVLEVAGPLPDPVARVLARF